MDADGSISAAEAEKFVQENHKDEDLDVQGACVRLPVSNLKPKEGRKRKLSVGFSAEKPLVQIFEIEDGNNFRKTPTQTKLKCMAGRWSNPFALSTGRKKLRVDIMDDVDEEKKKQAESNQSNVSNTSSSDSTSSETSDLSPPPPSSPTIHQYDASTMKIEEIEERFLEIAKVSFKKLLQRYRLSRSHLKLASKPKVNQSLNRTSSRPVMTIAYICRNSDDTLFM